MRFIMQTSKIEDLARLSLKGKPIVVGRERMDEGGREWIREPGKERARERMDERAREWMRERGKEREGGERERE